MLLSVEGAESNGRTSEGPAKFYKLTGYKPARELAEKLVKFIRFRAACYDEDGRFIAERHFHSRTINLVNMVGVALDTGDKELLEFVRKSFEWAKSTEAGTCTETGFMPEYAVRTYKTCEGCEVGDMINIAVKLSAAGAGDYWEDAERWTRNHFAEIQLTESKAKHLIRLEKSWKKKPLLYNETGDRVIERSIGAFGGWTTGNEWWSSGDIDVDTVGSSSNLIMHCCTGNCTRAIYFIWRHILSYHEGQLRINMLLNRASPWADVYSYIPYEGQVNIKMKKTCTSVLVHAPEWIETASDQIVATVNGEPRPVTWEKRYVNLGKVAAGETASIKFPITERTVKEKMGLAEYTLILKGNTVVSIDPPGKDCPLYDDRERYRNNDVQWRKVERFVSDEGIAW
jgi:hypothetical protein